MKYKDFKDAILLQIAEKYSDCQVEIMPVIKNNDNVLDGIVIRSEGSNIFLNIYLNAFYKDYENGRSISDIIEEITSMYAQRNIVGNFDASHITDWEQAKEHIICKLCNAAENGQYLADKPFTQIEDLAVTYHLVISQQEHALLLFRR